MKSKTLVTLLLLSAQMAAHAGEPERDYSFANLKKYTEEAQQSRDAAKEKSIEAFRQEYKKNGHRTHSVTSVKESWSELMNLLNADGTFKDMPGLTEGVEITFDNRDALQRCISRLGKIAYCYGQGEASFEETFTDAYQKALLFYGTLEISRPNINYRFHGSCFAIPTAAVNIYFSYLDTMDKIESGEIQDKQMTQVCDMIKMLALQSWTQPLRNDYTDEDVTQIDRFRNHVWWVGGNGLAFRSILPTACMFKSIPMIDVLATVSQNGIGLTSQATNATAFWTEGFTADGAGWGHGRQSLIWGYPISGTNSALELMCDFKGTPWERKLSERNKHALMNFLQGSNWYHYKGAWTPGVDRTTYNLSFMNADKMISSAVIVRNLLSNWADSFTPEEIQELKQFATDMELYKTSNLAMEGYPAGDYNGTRYFFNNDDLIKKNNNYHCIINMASTRVDGLESATDMADEYNFCTNDGGTLFQRSGREYNNIYGAYDVLSYPGVTARLGMDKLTPVTNWKGYMSKHNFAAGATFGEENAAAGYIFEKENGAEKEGANDEGGSANKNEIIYGVQAYKSYFILGDYFVALGAGVENLKPALEGDIHTTIDQTEYATSVFLMGEDGVANRVGEGTHSMFVKGKPAWVMQEGKFAYRVLGDYTEEANFTIETRKTDWVKMNAANAKYKGASTSVDILQLWVDHGHAPKNDTYGYVVYMGEGTPALKPTFKVLANTTQLQAVESTDGNVLEATIYNADEKVKGKSITLEASVPCVVLVEMSGKDKGRVVVTDPTMSADIKAILLTINGKKVSVPMLDGELSGKPVAVEF